MDVSLKKSDLLLFEGKEYLVEGGWLGLLCFSRIAKYLILKYKKNEKIVHKKNIHIYYYLKNCSYLISEKNRVKFKISAE
ncbi:hypothetical protein [Rhodocytophaga aerolata]|uniref:hypothetical protein n=1 Tax=Rhodocytophaga aerolata TaxID=455078 RepID=UPI003671A00F